VSVRPTGVDTAGDFDVPPSVDTVGWYRYGPGLDAAGGSVVIAGHVDSATQGPGAFFRLRELTRGQPVAVTGEDGRTRQFTVVAREEYPKESINLNRYFTSSGPLRLTLMTCGGPFDDRTHHYRDNVVVTAVPLT
jgi:Sortase domain